MNIANPLNRIVSGWVQFTLDSTGVIKVTDSGANAFSIFHYFGNANTHAGLDVFSAGDPTASIDAYYNVASAGRQTFIQATAGPSSHFGLVTTSKAGGTGAHSYWSPENMADPVTGIKSNLRWVTYVDNPVTVAWIGMDSAGIFCGGKTAKWQFQSVIGDGAGNIAYEYDTLNTLSTAGTIHTSWKNNTSQLMALDYAGILSVASGNFATPVSVDLAANSAGAATTFARSNHKHALDQSIAPTWSGVHTFSLETIHTLGAKLTNGLLETSVANTASNVAFHFQDTIARTSIQDILKFDSTDTGTPQYMRQLNTGEFTCGYGSASGTPMAPQTGYILGFIASTASHPSWAATVLKGGVLAYVNHTETTITPTNVSGVTGQGFIGGTSSTVPSNTMPAFGVLGVTGCGADSASYSGKKLGSFVAGFTGATGDSYKNTTLDQALNAESVYGNYDIATEFFFNARAYMFAKGGVANPTNKPALVCTMRVPIQGMGGTTQAGILGVNRIAARSTATGHVDENINGCTTSFFMSVPFAPVTVAAGSTLRATNAAHYAVQAWPAALAGPTWATWTNPEDSETKNYYGEYLDSGTNNPFGWYQHDGTSWQRQIGVVANGRFTGQTAAKATVASYTVPASDASFEVSMNILVTTSTLHTFNAECAYTDEGNTARVVTLSFCNLAGAFVTAIANAAGAVPYEGVPLHIRAKAATTITLRTQAAGTYTTVTYNVEGSIRALT